MDYALYPIDALPAGELSLLSEDERAVYARRGEPYLRVRSLLRRELGRRLGCAPAEVKLTIGQHGKPLCAEQPFNLSHAGGLLALAFHHDTIGIDIERWRPLPHAEGMAARIMGAEQLEDFRRQGCPEDVFFDCWCAAEALVKWAGASVFDARRFPFLLKQGRILPLFENAPCVELFHPRPDFSGAVAYCP